MAVLPLRNRFDLLHKAKYQKPNTNYQLPKYRHWYLSLSQMELLAYVAVKFTAYVAWCGVGVALFRPESSNKLRAALGFGLLRLLLGIVFGVSLFLGAAVLQVGNSGLGHLAIYLLMYVPLRWVEWSIMGYLLQPDASSLLIAPARMHAGAAGSLAAGHGPRAAGVFWKLGGILVSHLADLPVILRAGGIDNMLPIGRFLC
jgi:hypothetical protein